MQKAALIFSGVSSPYFMLMGLGGRNSDRHREVAYLCFVLSWASPGGIWASGCKSSPRLLYSLICCRGHVSWDYGSCLQVASLPSASQRVVTGSGKAASRRIQWKQQSCRGCRWTCIHALLLAIVRGSLDSRRWKKLLLSVAGISISLGPVSGSNALWIWGSTPWT